MDLIPVLIFFHFPVYGGYSVSTLLRAVLFNSRFKLHLGYPRVDTQMKKTCPTVHSLPDELLLRVFAGIPPVDRRHIVSLGTAPSSLKA
ncbi:hypothetical protein WJX72_000817 [[Myrmecia] bisecta]|uniref:F-box domain-containing protein n=1 Tax=[Myrmecia] bisecta TaxID=41462 RepID=A0AAW1R442_9CHLO